MQNTGLYSISIVAGGKFSDADIRERLECRRTSAS